MLIAHVQITHGISIENGINVIFPDANNGDAVKKCESAEDLARNVIELHVSLAETEAIPDWIVNDLIDDVEDTIISIPAESRAIFIDFLEALFNYKNHIDELQTDLSLKVVKMVQAIKSDTVTNDLISNLTTIRSDDENPSKEIFEHCSLIDATQESITIFNANINQCINTFRFEIAPEIGQIVNQTIVIASKPNVAAENAAETEDTNTNITKLTELIKSQNEISNIHRNEAMDRFSVCLENNKNQCISILSTILTKMISN